MFNLKSLLGAAAVLPVVAAGLFGSVGSAQASGFNYAQTYSTNPSNPTSAVINTSLIDFTAPIGTPAVLLSNQDGVFTPFYTAYINDINYNPLVPNPSQFMDLGSTFGSPEFPSGDGNDTFSLTSFDPANPIFKSLAGGVSLSYNFGGIFDQGAKDGLNVMNGIGNIIFDIRYNAANGMNFNEVVAKYNAGQNLAGSFTGLVVTSVPEPTTMLGLGLVAAGMTVARRRKAVTA